MVQLFQTERISNKRLYQYANNRTAFLFLLKWFNSCKLKDFMCNGIVNLAALTVKQYDASAKTNWFLFINVIGVVPGLAIKNIEIGLVIGLLAGRLVKQKNNCCDVSYQIAYFHLPKSIAWAIRFSAQKK